MNTEDETASHEHLEIIFQSLYQRSPNEVEQKANLNRKIRDVITDIRRDPAFAVHLPNLFQPYTLRYGMPHVADTDRFYNILEQSPLSASACHQMIVARYMEGDYYNFHKIRFQELHGLVGKVDAERSVKRLLEVSTMPYTTGVWKDYLKQLGGLTTIDLPHAKGGPTTERVLDFGADKHVEIDLNAADLDRLATEVTEGGGYDVIIATEVVEHLQRDFSEIAAFALKCLAPRGVAIITTPNAVCEMSMLYVFNGRNPYQRFLGYNANHGGHFHFREYSMAEMLEDVGKVGASPFLQVYSSCWRDDGERFKTADRYHLRTNSILLFGRKEDLDLWN